MMFLIDDVMCSTVYIIILVSAAVGFLRGAVRARTEFTPVHV